MLIQVFGPGCARCRTVAENARRAVEELGKDAQIEQIEDVETIMRAGVLMTPAVMIDGKLVGSGHLLSLEALKEIISR
jgi:small redox-active disulfide protein 2